MLRDDRTKPRFVKSWAEIQSPEQARPEGGGLGPRHTRCRSGNSNPNSAKPRNGKANSNRTELRMGRGGPGSAWSGKSMKIPGRVQPQMKKAELEHERPCKESTGPVSTESGTMLSQAPLPACLQDTCNSESNACPGSQRQGQGARKSAPNRQATSNRKLYADAEFHEPVGKGICFVKRR